ncbi:hypothetical protein CTI12_AA161980 [Artemisia annua]|uniref:Uncharacterized protein n=1 Tax=Artemisia annua TaxID=35608 RepID=A0A2U1PE91_ARTAN|nr:hypothetical protein CTI12_AA161980 [Artemisia annua]
MDYYYDHLVDDYDQVLSPLRQCDNIPSNLIDELSTILYKLHQQKRFTKPMPTIGMYIALASFSCIIAMVADLSRSSENKNMWIPCKYFSLNAVSLTVIAVAVKLPMDLTNTMAGYMDQEAKLGSLAFMCIMMSYLLPSLATMNIKDLVTNIIALGVLVITLVVNVGIQLNTGLVSYSEDRPTKEDGGQIIKPSDHIKTGFGYANREIVFTYIAVLLMLLMIYICSALMILKSKQDLESKYQAAHERALIVQQQPGQLTVENLKQRVINYAIMAATSSPQLMTVCSATSSASAVIGVSISLLHVFITFNDHISKSNYTVYDSDYDWSILAISYTQTTGIIVGAIVLVFRFYAPLTFKPSTEWIWNLIKFYEVESCWTHTLSDWKRNRLYASSSPNFKIIFYKLQILGLTLLTLSQKAIVRTCKAIRIIPVLMSIWFSYCFVFVRWFIFWLVSLFGIQLRRQPQPNRDIRQYVLQPQDHMEVGDKALEYIFKLVERLIQNAEKKQPSKLMKLLENFSDFEGVRKFDSLLVDLDQSLLGVEYPNCWSLPVVTLATMALSLRSIRHSTLKNFLNEVSEGLVYVKLVEKSLNNNDELVSVQKAAERLWPEVEVYHKWLGNNLEDPDFRRKTAIQIVEWFNEKARNMVTAVGSKESGGPNDDSICRSICANSMYRLTKTLMLSYQANNDQVSQEDLFAQLSSMISDIVAACLTNLPEVITLKCHTSAIEKREESVHAAAKLLGKTSEILNTLRDRELPSLNPGELPFIDSWRDYLTAPPP